MSLLHGHRVAPGAAYIAIGAVLAATALVLVPSMAWAHEGEEEVPAYDSVRQAIALMVNTPGNHEAIEDKIGDALESKDTDRVKLPLVEQAKAAMAREDEHGTRALLEAAIGARVHTSNADPVPIDEPPPATGAETGTVAAVDAIPGRHGLTGGDWLALAVSLLVATGGAVLAFRLYPRPSANPPSDR